MSQSLSYVGCDVDVTFKNEDEMHSRIKAFEQAVEKWDKECEDTDYDIGNPTRAYVRVDTEKLTAQVCVDDDGDTWVNDEKLVELICKHFPNANGSVGWANVDLRHGYCYYANGGETVIKNGKVVDKDKEVQKQLRDLKYDLDMALEYITMVISNGDITECGVAHLFKKYWPEEWADAVKEKLQEVK